MSLLWRDEVDIFLSPHKLSLVRRSRGLRRRLLASAEEEVPAGSTGVFESLAQLLTDPTWQNAVARVVVANQAWARYAVVPWPDARLDEAGRLAHARFVLADAYGAAVADWAVTLADSPPGLPSVACAMPAAFRPALEQALLPAKLELVSLQPQLIAAFNGWRYKLPADNAWFVTLDEWSLAAVHLSGGAWDRVHMARLPQDWSVELDRLLAFCRMTLAGAAAPARVFVDAPHFMRRGATGSEGLEWLDDSDGRTTHELALLQRRPS